MLDKEIFVNSVEALIDFGDNKLYYDNMRQYIVQYEETKKYMDKYRGESYTLNKFYSKLPELEYKEFNNPILKALSKILATEKNKGFRFPIYRSSIWDLLEDASNDVYPARKKYYNDLVLQVLNINLAFAQMLKEFSEEPSSI